VQIATHQQETATVLKSALKYGAIVAGIAAFVFGDHLRTETFATIQSTGYWGLLVLALVVIAALCAAAYFLEQTVLYGGAVGQLVIALAVTVPGLVQSEYHNARVAYEPATTFTDKAPPTFAERPPWRLANNLLRRNAENLRGNPADARYVIDGDEGRYTMLVNGESTGRKTSGVVEWDGEGNRSSDFTTCRFDGGAVRALDGNLWNSLPRRINNTSGGSGLLFDTGDAYGICVDGKARLYWPATKQSGFPATTRVFGALVIVDHDGSISFDRNVKAGEHPGPVYPISLAKAQQSGIKASGSFGDWWKNRAKVAYDEDGVAGFGENPDDNPNTGNTGQFALVTDDGRAVYVTPLIPNKTSKMISHLAIVEQDHARTGTVNDMKVHKLPERRKSNVEVSQLIKATYANLPYSSGIQIMEVTPRDDHWVGTIGQQLVATYRFEIDADGESCLFDYRSGRQVRCSEDAQAEPGSEEAPGLLTDEQLTQLSAQELRDLRAQVDDEFDRRLDEAGQQTAEGGAEG
jgi:hypothetical protein